MTNSTTHTANTSVTTGERAGGARRTVTAGRRLAIAGGIAALGIGLIGAPTAVAAGPADQQPTPSSTAPGTLASSISQFFGPASDVQGSDLTTLAEAQRAADVADLFDGPLTIEPFRIEHDRSPAGTPFDLDALRAGAAASAVVSYRAVQGSGVDHPERGFVVIQRSWGYPSAQDASEAVTAHLDALRQVDLGALDGFYTDLTVSSPGGMPGDDGYWVVAGHRYGGTDQLVLRQGNLVTVLEIRGYDGDAELGATGEAIDQARQLTERQQSRHGSSDRTPAVTELMDSPIMVGG